MESKESGFDEELIKKIKSMSKEEMEKYFLRLPREKAASYKEIYMRVLMLEDFYVILSELPKESFKSRFNFKIKDMNGNPADALKDYIVLEIKKFYELASQANNGLRLPPAPDHWTILGKIRDMRIAHPDTESKSNEDAQKLYREIDKVGLDNIVEEFKKYAIGCISQVNKWEFYEKGVHNLKKLMEEGKIHLLNDPKIKKSLRMVKIRLDGSIIESSINSTMRALLLAIEAARSDND